MASRSEASENRFQEKEKGSEKGSEREQRERQANREAFPGVADIVDAFRAAGASDGLPPFNPKVLWASENGREIGKRVPFESDDTDELIARLDRKP